MIKFLHTGASKKNGRGRGLRLFRWGNRQLELWWFPAGEVVEDHIHNHAVVRLFFIFGKMVFWSAPTGTKRKTLTHLGSTLRIPVGVAHGAQIQRSSIFLTYEKWNDSPTTIAHDIEFTDRTIQPISGGVSA